jgi:predicted nucleotidyltransferase
MTDDLAALAEKTKPVFKKYGFRKVAVFGSRARGDNRADSDADFLFSDKGKRIGFLEKQEAQEELKNILGVDVDLVPDTGVIARMRPRIKRELKVIYEGQ